MLNSSSKRCAGLVLAAALLSGGGTAAALAATEPVDVLPIRPDVYMLTVDGVNVGVESGPQGTVVVDTGPASASEALIAAIKKISSQPIRFVIDTNADAELIGGNASVAAAGESLAGLLGFNQVNGVASAQLGNTATVVGRQNLLQQLIARGESNSAALPAETFTRPQYNFWINGQGVSVVRESAAHSDADSAVLFRRSDVVVTGAIFDITHFPVIDLAHGGSISGEIDALNDVLNVLVIAPVPVVTNDEGTLVIPEHGPVCNQADVLAYRDMVYAVRYRIQDLIDHGKSFAQVQAADPTQGYNSRYGSDSGRGTSADFVQAVYRSLIAEKRAHGRKG